MRPPSWPTASSAPRKRALKREANGTRFRLLGVGLSNLTPAEGADPAEPDRPRSDKRAAAERAMDKIRAKFGGEAVGTGRSFRNERPIKK